MPFLKGLSMLSDKPEMFGTNKRAVQRHRHEKDLLQHHRRIQL